MSGLLAALGSGISASKILDYLIKKAPQLSPKISQALSAGFSAEKIIEFFSRDKEFEKLKDYMQREYSLENNANPLVQAENIRGKNLAEDLGTQLQNKVPGIVGTAAVAGGAYALSRAIPMGIQALGALNPQTASTQTLPQTPSIPQTPVPPSAPQAQQVPNIQQPVNLKQVLDKYPGFVSKIEELRKGSSNNPAGNDAVSIAAYFQSVHPKETKILEKEAGMPIEEIVERYFLNNSNPVNGTPQEQQSTSQEMVALPGETASQVQRRLKLNYPDAVRLVEKASTPTLNQENKTENVEIPQIEEKKSPKIEKSSTVISPNGVGQVKEIRNGKALIEVDGKKHQVDEEDLIASPIPEKELADLYDEMIQGIEKETGQEVSRNVEWAGYDPVNNALGYRPHGAGMYVYEDISPEDKELLTSMLVQRKSTGRNFIGAWKKGTDSPIGAAMHQLLQRLQKERGGKGNEYKYKFQTAYDAIEPARSAAQKREQDAKRKKKKA